MLLLHTWTRILYTINSEIFVLWMFPKVIFAGLNRRQECYVINYSQWEHFVRFIFIVLCNYEYVPTTKNFPIYNRYPTVPNFKARNVRGLVTWNIAKTTFVSGKRTITNMEWRFCTLMFVTRGNTYKTANSQLLECWCYKYFVIYITSPKEVYIQPSLVHGDTSNTTPVHVLAFSSNNSSMWQQQHFQHHLM